MNTEAPFASPSEEGAAPEVATFRYSSPRSRRPAIGMPRLSLPSAKSFLGVLAGFLVGLLAFGFVATSGLSPLVALRQRLGVGPGGDAGLTLGAATVKQQLTVQETSAVIQAAKKVSPAVVSITASQQVRSFFGQPSSQEVSSGSGFIITPDGLILTNKHVVSGQGVTYKVVLDDGRVLDATVQATDPLNDLAVVKVNASNLPTVTFGSSDSLQVGQEVLAIGNALGEFQNSVTSGIVSGKGRSIAPQSDTGSTEQLTDLIQTDAAINPGNSGGPLVNLDGQVVGIDTAIASTTGGSVGIGFAIPVDDFTGVIASVEKTGKITVPYLGLRYQQIDTTVKQLNNLSVDYGVQVTGNAAQGEVPVVPGGPADKAGIQAGDIILSLGGDRIDSHTTLQRLLQRHQPGETVQLVVLRAGKQQNVPVTLGSQ